MRALRISANGWWQTIDIEPAVTNRHRSATLGLRHNIALRYCADTITDAEPNMAAMALLPAVSDLEPEAVPMIYGDAVVMGVDPDTGEPAPMNAQQYHAISYALLSSLAA
ncbi:hypothetical protein [Mycolicibacterium palauense]|uniref:hypothetical protein n=1 Tax=Mycolicibacterium palauense TaxID=2034511 RepID=UPI000BFEE86F|nr:hypothetical protein [Mycolicibacterium palauense]